MLEIVIITAAVGLVVGLFGCMVVAGACRGSLNEANEERARPIKSEGGS